MNTEKQKTILLVEDEVIIAMTEKMTLEKFGYRVLAVHCGEDAVTTVARTAGIDLILMDIDLGKGMDGTEAAAIILKDHDLPVVFLSSHMEPEVVAKTEKITSYGYVVKNSSGTVLDASIKMAFKLFEANASEKKKELALSQSNDLFTKLARLVPGVIYQYRLDPDGRSAFPYASPGMNDIYEVTPEEVRDDATAVFARLHPEDYDRVAGAIQASALTLNTFYCEFRVLLPRQGLRWRWSQAYPERLADGGTLWHGIISDITQRKLAEEALRESEERMRAIVEGTPHLFFYTQDAEANTIYVSPTIEQITGYKPGVWQKRRDWFITDAAINREAKARTQAHLRGDFSGKPVLLEIHHSLGHEILIEVYEYPITQNGRIVGLQGVAHDISARKKTEEALRTAENTYRNIFLNAQTGLFRTDIKTSVILDANDSVARFIGFKDRGELLAKPFNIAERYIDRKDRERMVSILQKDGQLNNFETRFKRNDGSIIWIRMAARIVPEKGWIEGVAEDITKEKAAEAALQDSEEKFRLLVENINDVIYTLDASGRITYISPVIERISGRKPAVFLGKNFSEFVHPDDLPVLAEKFKQTLGGARESFEFRVINGNQIHHVRTSSQRLLNNGVVSGLNGLMSDITEENRAEFQREAALQELQEAKALIDAVIESVPLMIFLKEATDLKFVIFNRAGEELLGYDRKAFLGKNNLDLFPPEQAAHFMAKDREVLDGEASILDIPEEPILTAGKETRLLHTRKVCIRGADGKSKYLLGISEDITERKQVELALRESEERFHSFFDNSNAGIYRTAPDGSIHLANPALVRMLGYSSFAELTEKDLNKTGFEPSYPRAQFVAKIEKDGEVKGLESVWKRKDGGTIIVRESARAIRDTHGKTLFYDGIVEDICESKRAQTALQETNNRLVLAMQAADMAWWEMDLASGQVTFAKRKAEMLGFPAEKFKHFQDFVALVHADDREKAMAAMRGHLDGSLPRYEVDYRIADSSGRYVWFHDIGSVGKRDACNKPLNVTGLVINISGRKQAEDEIKRQLTEKEILLKEVHHRIKNNIASIGGLLSLHLQSITSPEAVAALQDAIGRVDSMRLLYDKLLLGGDFQDASVKNYIESLAASVVSLFPDLAKVKLNLDVDDFKLDPKRLFPLGIIINELLTNIMKYAFAGKMSGTIKLALAKDGARVTLNLEDNGVGLPAGFDISASKGFGLTLVKMLSQQLKGSFSIETHKGTRCRLEFVV